MSKKYALLIGINRYPYMAEKYQLNGCVNDAKLFKSILKNKFGFEPTNIITLYDDAATREGILAAMNQILEVIEDNDIVVFHFSGHGHECRVKTEFSDEGSGTINCIIPHDDNEPAPIDPELAPEGKMWREIREGQINQWLQNVAKITPYTTLIFDACHSGTITRSAKSTNIRSIPHESRPQVVLEQRVDSVDGFSTVDNAPSTSKKVGWLTLSDNYVVISGCRDTQKSKEDDFSEQGMLFKHGILSYFLCGALNKAKPGTTYRDIFEVVNAGVVSRVNGQNPQIEGSIDREVFGVKEIEPFAFIPIIDIDGNQVVLEGGAAHGLRNGSQWYIYPSFTKQAIPESRIGKLKIFQVGAVTSNADLLEGVNNISIGARCVEIETGYVADKLTVYLNQTSDVNLVDIERGIINSQLLELAESPGSADIHGEIINADSDLVETLTNEQKQNITFPVWMFFETQDELCMPPHIANDPNVTKNLVDNLEKIARFRNILKLDNVNTSLNVEFNLYKRQADDSLVLANGGNSEFVDGTTSMVLEIKNNDPNRSVFFSLLWISATREISSVYPYRKASEELSPGKTVRIGGGSNKLTASLSDSYFLETGSEACKVIFSTTESDFRWLNQDALRSTPESAVSAFDNAFNGEDPNSTESNLQLTNDWDAITRSFVLIRNVSS
jgi:hypothetical protein